eukprot:Hpha_TRINITY_DN15433_c0_g1::TRINITY_DN15433_c0_g1_i2::g.175956::m.175956
MAGEAAEMSAFLQADAERLLNEAYDKALDRQIAAAAAGEKPPKVTAPDLFAPVHAATPARPVIGGTQRFSELWSLAKQIPGEGGVDEIELEPGMKVVAQGLEARGDLNGRNGTLTTQQGDRWGVLFSGESQAVALLPRNLRVVEEDCPEQP